MDDSAIVELFWKRDEQAIAATTEKYNVYCLSIAMNILGNIEDAEECVNDAYLNTWNSIPPNKPKMLSTYLGKIVRNMSFNLYKKNRACDSPCCALRFSVQNIDFLIRIIIN